MTRNQEDLAMEHEWLEWRELCNFMLLHNIVTSEDAKSSQSDGNSVGQQLFRYIRQWGESVRALESKRKAIHYVIKNWFPDMDQIDVIVGDDEHELTKDKCSFRVQVCRDEHGDVHVDIEDVEDGGYTCMILGQESETQRL